MKFQPKSERSVESTKRFRSQVARCHACLTDGTWITIEELVKLVGTSNAMALVAESRNNPQLRCMLATIAYCANRYPSNDRRSRREMNADVYSTGLIAQSLMDAWERAAYDCVLEHDKNGQECIHALWAKYNSAALEHRALKAIYAQYSKEAGEKRATKRMSRMVQEELEATKDAEFNDPQPAPTGGAGIHTINPDNNGE
jgi:hypothetical protein